MLRLFQQCDIFYCASIKYLHVLNQWIQMITIKILISCSANGAYTSYGSSKRSTALFLSELQCSGVEGDIGLCSGNFDIQNCSTESVAVDCTGSIFF